MELAAGLIVDLRVGLRRTLLLDESYCLLDHRNGFVLARPIGGGSATGKDRCREKDGNERLSRTNVQFPLHRLPRRYELTVPLEIAPKSKRFVKTPWGAQTLYRNTI